jgi:hypothetical protein
MWPYGNFARSRYGNPDIGSKIESAPAFDAITQLFLLAVPFHTEDRESVSRGLACRTEILAPR